ncbi:MAG: ribonuclease E/G [Rhodospirillales bacterium]|nr:ribonuclease E/G [Rhodospirillales bacterium]
MTTRKMLIDATHPEETRVVVVSGTRLEDFDVEVASRKQLKGNIYLAKVTRVEPSLQAAFVDYGGNRHGFLAFNEIHPDYYQIPVEDRQALIAEDAAAGKAERAERASAAAADSGGEGAPEGAEPKATPVEILGGDSDDDLEVRRPLPSRRRHYKIQEVVKRRQILLVQVVKEERGTKGAALTTYLSLAGRYCVLMPNTARGGGISRKIAGGADRKRLKSVVDELDIPEGMAVIVRTAGAERTKTEIKRDYDYLMRTWTEVRERTLESIAPSLVYEEGSIIKRAIRDLYSSDIDEVIVAGDETYRQARELMKLLVPSHIKRVKPYNDETVSLLRRYQIEDQLASIHSPQVQLRSGGYIVINQTEALVSIDVNSGRATRERHIEETALRTNLEAADEIARQLRLRDLAGLIVIDFIDMESNRNQVQVERRLKEAMRHDRARIQIGRISHFGLLEMSRQRLRPSLIETSSVPCPYCGGTGIRRATDTSALTVLRAIEDEGARSRADEITVHAATPVVLYILNQKRAALGELERRFAFHVVLAADDTLVPPAHRVDRTKPRTGAPVAAAPPPAQAAPEEAEAVPEAETEIGPAEGEAGAEAVPAGDPPAEGVPQRPYQPPAGEGMEGAPGAGGGRRRRRRRRRGRGGHPGEGPRIEGQRESGFPGGAYPLGAPQPEGYAGGPERAEPGAGGIEPPAPMEGGEEHAPEAYAEEAGPEQPGQPAFGGFEPGGEGQFREGRRRRRRRGRRGGRHRHRHGEPAGFTGGEHVGGEHRGSEHRGAPPGQPAGGGFGVPQGGERRGLQVTTPAEAGIAFLDGPRLGGYGTEIESGEHEETEQPAPLPTAVPEPERPAFAAAPAVEAGAEAKPAPAREEKAPEPAPAPPREETPEERERRLRASKTEIVEVGKVEGAPAKRGWWRRGG